jgi:hypothetical protein
MNKSYEHSRAAETPLRGRMRPAGRQLDSSDLHDFRHLVLNHSQTGFIAAEGSGVEKSSFAALERFRNVESACYYVCSTLAANVIWGFRNLAPGVGL